MKVPLKQIPPEPCGSDPALAALLREGWRSAVARGAVAYDPAAVRPVLAPPYMFLYLPGREARPRTPLQGFQGPLGGLRRPHTPCPFDTQEFLDEREVIRLARDGRCYHIAINKYPVLPQHYLAVRPAGDPPETLPQKLHGPEEISDMFRLAVLFGPQYRFFFNSNQGADGSRSGSSVNHWHFQIFPTEWGVVAQEPRLTAAREGVESGEAAGWAAHHRAWRSQDPDALARQVWAAVEPINRRDSAYNLEAASRPDGSVVAFLFPRAPTEDLRLPGGTVLSGDFGGFELSGSVVVPDRTIFDWVREHPAEAAEIVTRRIREGTAPV